MPWEPIDGKRIAGLSSFGFSGTNAHVIVEEFVGQEEIKTELWTKPLQLLTLSAKSEEALQELADRFLNYLDTHPETSFSEICFTANTGRNHFNHCLALIADSGTQAAQQLQNYLNGNQSFGLFSGKTPESSNPKIAFLFSPENSELVEMGYRLYQTQPVFRQEIDRCATILAPDLETPLLDILYSQQDLSPNPSPTRRGENSQQTTTIALFAVEYALAKLWLSWGIYPDVAIGHGVGECVAATIAGAISLADALKLITQRAHLHQNLPTNGAMAAALDLLEAQISQFSLSEPKIDLISSITGTKITKETTQPSYWRQQIAETGKFDRALATLQEEGCEVFIEIGPNPVLLNTARQTVNPKGLWLASLRKGQENWQVLLSSLVSLYLRGIKIDWTGFDRDYAGRRLSLPTYPFQRQRYWFESETAKIDRHNAKEISVTTTQQLTPKLEPQIGLEERLVTLVAKNTGIPVSQLGLDLSLEAQLGLDSIVMTQLITSIVKLIPEGKREAFNAEVSMRDLMELQTLRDILKVIEPWQETEIDISSETSQTTTPHSNLTLTPILSHKEREKEGDGDNQQPITKLENSVDILHGQYFHLLGYWLVNSTSLFSTVRVRGEFDLKIAWDSWQDLIARHPMLRSRFVIPQGATRFKDYQLEILDKPTPPAIPLTDLRQVDRDTQDRQIEEEKHRWLNYHWSLTEWPLHQFSVFHLEDSVYQIFFGNEHIISDGLSTHIIWREFWENYSARVSGRNPQLPPATSIEEYVETVKAMNNWQDADEDKALAEYTLNFGKQAYFWNPTGKNTSSQQPQFYSHKYILERETTAKLIAKTRELRLSVNSLLIGAFLRAIAKLEQSEKPIVLQIPTGGRIYPGVDASNMISSFAQNLALSFAPTNNEESWQDLLQRIDREIQQGIATGIDRAQTRQMGTIFQERIPLEDGKIPAHSLALFQGALKSNLYLPYTGHTHIKTRYDSIELTEYQAGGINASGTIDILQEIFDDRLHLFASYDYNLFTLSSIDRLMQEYIAQIEELISIEATAKGELPSPPTPLPLGEGSRDISILLKIASEVFHQSLNTEDINKDLEADLGLDSLGRIRIVTRLYKEYGKVDRRALLACRSLQEMASILFGSIDKSKEILPLQTLQTTKQEELVAESNSKTEKLVTDNWSLITKIEIPYLKIIRQAQTIPEAIAVLHGDTKLSYGQLHQLSNQVANYLRELGVGRNSLVGIMTQRGPLMLIGILGIVKAGGAYVPLDPSYPAERIRYILDHAEIKVLLTESGLNKQLQECLDPQLPLSHLIFLDKSKPIESLDRLTQVSRSNWSEFPTEDPNFINDPDDLMTVLYTSGSTGKPKGVMLNHRGYMNRLVWMQKVFQLKPGDRVAQKTSFCFDISVWELFWTLMDGATICPVAREIVLNPWDFAEWMKETKINVMHFVPSLFGEFINALEDETWSFPDLRWLIFSGEALPTAFIQKWIDRYGMETGLANLYGPTEASIDVTYHIISQRPDSGSIPIGKAIDNVYLRILDDKMQSVAAGEMGELWLGGIQLAKGYLKDVDRSAKAFCPNPFPEIPGECIYRTGDLARELPDGSIEYHGRIDSQVKIRGFRVELGEIESVLSDRSGIREAAVLALDYESGEKQLVAWVAGEKVDNRLLKEHLERKLPHYMIPAQFHWLTSLPKNHNGKLDRKALLDIFKNSEMLVDRGNGQQETDNKIEKESKIQNPKSKILLPLGPAQRWLVKYFDSPYQWTGYSRCRYHRPLNLEIFQQSLNLIIERHPALRTIFICQDGQWQQHLLDRPPSIELKYHDGSNLSSEKRDEEIRTRIQSLSEQLRLDRFPLLVASMVKVNESCYDIAIVLHHIIADLLSSNVLFTELWSAYDRLLAGEIPSFEHNSPLSYLDCVRLLQAKDERGELNSHVEYWQSKFPSPECGFTIPLDLNAGENNEASAMRELFPLGSDRTQLLMSQAKQHYRANAYHLLLAPLYQLMANWSNQSWIVLSHRSHGRDLGDNQMFWHSIGNFALNFPVGVNLPKKTNWEGVISQIKAEFDALPMKGVTFDWLADRLPTGIYPGENLTPVRANYLGNRSITDSDVFEFFKEERDRRLCPSNQKRTTLLECFFFSIDRNLYLEIEYSSNFHLPKTISQLGEQYLASIDSLLATVSPAKSLSES
jgi:amino acid adenylation domain-containing protein